MIKRYKRQENMEIHDRQRHERTRHIEEEAIG